MVKSTPLHNLSVALLAVLYAFVIGCCACLASVGVVVELKSLLQSVVACSCGLCAVATGCRCVYQRRFRFSFLCRLAQALIHLVVRGLPQWTLVNVPSPPVRMDEALAQKSPAQQEMDTPQRAQQQPTQRVTRLAPLILSGVGYFLLPCVLFTFRFGG